MTAGSTYTPIATQTLGSSAASVTFSSISGSYTDLILITNATSTSGGSQSISIKVGNGSVDTGANYSLTYLYGDGSSAVSGRYSNANYLYTGRVTNTNLSTGITHFQNYSNTTTYKTVLSEGRNAAAIIINLVNLWRSTSAINIMELGIDGGYSFASGSTFTLYGIAAA
jgi:hypothetical protein